MILNNDAYVFKWRSGLRRIRLRCTMRLSPTQVTISLSFALVLQLLLFLDSHTNWKTYRPTKIQNPKISAACTNNPFRWKTWLPFLDLLGKSSTPQVRIFGLIVIRMEANLAQTAEEQGTLTEVIQKYLESDDTGAQRAACEAIFELLEEGDEETRAQRRVSHKIIGEEFDCSCLSDRRSY